MYISTKKERKKVILSYKSTKICTKGKSFKMLNLGMISCLWQQKHKQQNNKRDTGPQKNEHFFFVGFIPLLNVICQLYLKKGIGKKEKPDVLYITGNYNHSKKATTEYNKEFISRIYGGSLELNT